MNFMEKNYKIALKYVKDDLKEMELNIMFVDAVLK